MAGIEDQAPRSLWKTFFRRGASPGAENQHKEKPKWNMGMLNDRETIEVPGKLARTGPPHNLLTLL